MRNNKLSTIAAAAALSAVMAIPAIAAADSHEGAKIRVLHGADAPAVDIWLNGAPGVTGLDFGQDTGYVELEAGEYQIQVVPAGAGIDDPANIVVDATVPFEAGTMTTIVATGSLDTGITPQLFADAPAPAEDMADVKVTHTSWDAPAVDILAGGAAVVEGLEFPNQEGPLSVPGGAYDFDVAVAGTDTIAIDIPELTLDNGVAYSVYAIGSLANETLTAVALVDTESEMMDEEMADDEMADDEMAEDGE